MRSGRTVDDDASPYTADQAQQRTRYGNLGPEPAQFVQQGGADKQRQRRPPKRHASDEIAVVRTNLVFKIAILLDGGWLAFLIVGGFQKDFDFLVRQARLVQLPVLPTHAGHKQRAEEKEDGDVFWPPEVGSDGERFV